MTPHELTLTYRGWHGPTSIYGVARDVSVLLAARSKAPGSDRGGPHALRHAVITNALDAGVPLRDAQILACHADPRTTEHYDRARGNLDRHGVHLLTAYVAGV